MLDFLKNAINFIKQYPAILYSLALVFLLPLSLYFSTSFTINSLEAQIGNFLESQSFIMEQTMAVFFRDAVNNPEYLQQKIDQLNAIANQGSGSLEPEFENLEVLTKNDDGFTIIAAQDKSLIGKKIPVGGNSDELINRIAISYKNGIPMVGYISQNGKRFWQVIQPLISDDQQKIGVISAMIPLYGIDAQMAQVVQRSYLILGIVILLTLFLIYQHTRLFSFVLLSDKLKEVDKLKDQFIRMATHELQSPVTTIRGYVEELKDELRDIANDEQKEYLERISLSAKNLADLIADILEVSHLQQGRMDFTPQKLLPSKVVSDIVENVRLKAEAKGLTLEFSGAECPYIINVNETRFKQIITNLLENSIKYTLKGGIKVSVSGDKAKKRVIILVQDTGLGISAEGQAHLFEQFYRVKTAENAGIPGTGLGLWMSKQMAQKMGGDILVESIEYVGSRFFVIFPLAEK